MNRDTLPTHGDRPQNGRPPSYPKPTQISFMRSNFSPSFLYPLKGIWYLTTHRYLHPLLRGRLIPLTVLSVCVLAILFLVAYLPIVALLAIWHYKGSAWVNGTFLVLEVGNLMIALLFEAIFVDHTQVDIFDAVLIAEGYEDLVKNRRPVSDDINESDPVKRLGAREKGAVFAPFSLRQIIEFVILLPLNFVPFAGVPLFLLATGYRAGPLLARRYFTLKGMTRKERNKFCTTKKRRWEYMWFGTVYMILQLVPPFSMLFLLTSAAGSALWSVHLEREELQSDGQGWEGYPPPEYTDDAA
ncbi:hypothetical protein K431DRAFT_287598 [Polychaeton citri CBS 116435]|uniref:EI24-domain-containing protein n=1 Tax=Polychaeton citri CBS 116435 TaxID=1314669 RepID=A0A9P4UMJ7_9PEZI|nr:hypothetical protein K431DRAFT_287598 [Polychaeton citri CBS 116435]